MAQLTSADLLQPNGDITPDWFPKLDDAGVATLLDAYLTDAYGRMPSAIVSEIAQNNAARSYAMGRASRNVLMRLSNTPANFKLDNEGSQSIISEQIKMFRQLAEKYEAEWSAATDVEDSGGTVDDAGQGAAYNTVIW